MEACVRIVRLYQHPRVSPERLVHTTTVSPQLRTRPYLMNSELISCDIRIEQIPLRLPLAGQIVRRLLPRYLYRHHHVVDRQLDQRDLPKMWG